MTNQLYIEHINELLQKCTDPDLLDLIYKILLQETSQQACNVA